LSGTGGIDRVADITTDVLIIGTGPAGSASAALLSSYGIANMAVNRYRWLAPTDHRKNGHRRIARNARGPPVLQCQCRSSDH
jgi:2-polyprenyl-6-methoxyphenol hydroxylase-like FAD-dependent oxidoreductase